MRSLIGLLILVPAWAAAVYLLSYPRGGLLLVVMVLIVAAADIGAYFSGKTFGKHKMAPAVSPAKTWEGFWGGVALCALLSLGLWSQLPDYAAHIGLGSAAGGLDVRRMTLQEITFFGTYTYSAADFRATAQAIFAGRLGALDWPEIRHLKDGAQAFHDIKADFAACPCS